MDGRFSRSFRQTSLVIDPPNGRTPPLVAGAELRRTPPGTYGNGPLDSPADFTLYDRCVTLGVVGSMTPKITDPKTYTRPYTISIPYTSPVGYQVLPYECHEGNLAVLQGLGGERAEDKALEEDAKRGIVRPRRPIQGGLTVGGQLIPEGGPR